MRIFNFIILVTIFSWCAGYFVFLYNGSKSKLEDNRFSDTIVVFGGNKQSLYVGAQLVKYGYAPSVFVTGDKPEEDYKAFLVENNISSDQFIYDVENANGGINDAKEVALFMRKNEFNSARIIAGSYQVSRAAVEIKANLPNRVTIIQHGIEPKKTDYLMIFKEYNKFLLVFMADLVGMANEVNLSYS